MALTRTSCPAVLTTSRRRTRRVLAGSLGARQNDAKSWSPASERAAVRIGPTFSGPGRCQTNRAVNASGRLAVSMRYTYSRPVAL